MPIKYPCNICQRPIAKNHREIKCDVCDKRVHIKCNYTPINEYERLQGNNIGWSCQKCTLSNIPFSTSSKDVLHLLNDGKLTVFIDHFDTEENVNVEFFRDVEEVFIREADEISVPTQCPYLSLSELNKNYAKNDNPELSLLHLNISSLKLHHAELDTLIKNCNVKFDIIGISETGLMKLIINENTELTGYTMEDTPTKAPKGGTRIYLSEELNYIPRKDLQIQKEGELESVCIEILKPGKQNIIAMCLYRHPHMDLREFNDNYENLLSKMRK